MSLPVSDNFNRANGGLGSNWTIQRETPAIVSNQAVGQSSGQHHQYWNADAFPNDQRAQVTFRVAYAGPAVRASGTGASGANNYFVTADAFNSAIYKQINGGFTELTTGAGHSGGDVMRLTVVGTALTAYKNGVQSMAASDGSLSSGSAGFQLFDTTGAADDWEGDDMRDDVFPMNRVALHHYRRDVFRSRAV